MLARLVNGLKPHLPPSLAKKWNVHFWIMFNFWWLAGLVDGLKPHPPPLSSQKREMLIFGLHSTSDNQTGWSMDSNPIHHPSPAKNVKCSFLDYIQLLIISRAGSMDSNPIHHPSPPKNMKCLSLYNIQHLMLARLVNGLEPHPPPLSSPKNEMLIFGLRSTSDNQPGWSMDSNPIHHPSPANKMKCSFLDYVELLIIGQAGWWTQTPSATPLQLIKWNAHFSNTFNFWWSAWLVNGLEPHLPALSSQKNEMLLFGLHSTSDDRLGWLMDSNPICQPSPAKKMKCYFLDYVQLLMIGWASQWTQTPSTTPLQPIKWNAHFCIMFTTDDQPGLSMDLNPIHHLSPAKKWNAHILIMFNFWWLAGLVNGLKPHPPPLSSQ